MTPAEHLEQCKRAARIARVELRNAAARFGAIANRRRCELRDYETAAAALDEAARAFVLAEERLHAAERPPRGDVRSNLCVIDGGE